MYASVRLGFACSNYANDLMWYNKYSYKCKITKRKNERRKTWHDTYK